MAATPAPKTRVSPLDTKQRDAQAKAAAAARARVQAYQDRNNPAMMTPAQKQAYLSNPGLSNY